MDTQTYEIKDPRDGSIFELQSDHPPTPEEARTAVAKYRVTSAKQSGQPTMGASVNIGDRTFPADALNPPADAVTLGQLRADPAGSMQRIGSILKQDLSDPKLWLQAALAYFGPKAIGVVGQLASSPAVQAGLSAARPALAKAALGYRGGQLVEAGDAALGAMRAATAPASSPVAPVAPPETVPGPLQGITAYRGAKATNQEWQSPAYFTTNIDEANSYAGVRNPATGADAPGRAGSQIQPVKLKINNPKDVSFAEIANATPETIARARAEGFDGLRYAQGGKEWYVPLDTAQIKTAFGPPPASARAPAQTIFAKPAENAPGGKAPQADLPPEPVPGAQRAKSPQQTLNEEAIARRRAEYQAKQQVASPAMAPEIEKEYLRLRGLGKTDEQAKQAILGSLQMNAEQGLKIPSEAQTKFPKGMRGKSAGRTVESQPANIPPEPQPVQKSSPSGTDIGNGVTRTQVGNGRTEYNGPGGHTTVTEDLTQDGKRFEAFLHKPDGTTSSLGYMRTAEEAHATAARRATNWHPGKDLPVFKNQ